MHVLNETERNVLAIAANAKTVRWCVTSERIPTCLCHSTDHLYILSYHWVSASTSGLSNKLELLNDWCARWNNRNMVLRSWSAHRHVKAGGGTCHLEMQTKNKYLCFIRTSYHTAVW